MTQRERTPEEHHSELIQSIEYEIDTYGTSSLAEVVATLVENRYDEDESDPVDAKYWQTVANIFHTVAEGIARLRVKPGGGKG